jgi:CubicO group peptidase (beta-lactamase class C family)
MALLGHILAEKAGGSYEEAVISMICDGLGLSDTRIALTSEQEERLATPHSGGGSPSRGWDLPAFTGAGALRSTANDVLRFLDAHIGKPASPLTDALKLSHERRADGFPTPGSLMRLFPGASRRRRVASSFTQSIGLGWMIGTVGEVGPETHWHHGATGGYIAFAGFVREADVGIVVMVNRGPRLPEMISGVSSADEIGFRVLKSLCSMS